MSKAIIKSTPKPTQQTNGQAMVVLNDSAFQTQVLFPCMDYTDKTNSGVDLIENDTVIIDLTSFTTCDITKKFEASQGTVTEMRSDSMGGKVKITKIETDTTGFGPPKVGDEINFDYGSTQQPYTGIIPKTGDTIEFICSSVMHSTISQVLEQAH